MLKSKKSSQRNSPLNNEKGMAIFEMIPIIVIIVLLINFSLGFFGAVHTGIMNSMAARNYAFSTFNHRANLTYFRSTRNADIHYKAYGMRIHGTRDESMNSGDNWAATKRKIDFFDFKDRPAVEGGSAAHNNQVPTVCDFSAQGCTNPRNDRVSVSPIWIKSSYGICLNAACGT
ncbi:hypothetical protein [Bdellovibrio svalbardensis]|uniref:Pilus assembly protein n=1 Tax=Bdellovibrio svalbardensis TaxID=2972972 RepID=A0ABT6DDD7_9BACT|nr:hypothetical protein [Bdellovibrio svalbardensis]MDG0814827.1 hypothetical protein [Bdellovibrio svalbardensis]